MKPTPTLVLFTISVLVAASGCGSCRSGGNSESPPPPRPRPPASGFPARGAAIAPATLEYHLPPPARDAVPYEVRHPLNNGPTVPVKKRWIWIPAGTRIGLSPVGDGVAVKVPAGALLWKEFYVRAGERFGLVERRVLLKVADRDQDNGWLLNGGWRFYTAHHLGPGAERAGTPEAAAQVPLGAAAPYFFAPERWMPTQAKGAATFVTFAARGHGYPYVFPGKSQCNVCHDGAAGGYENPESRPVLAFGPHPQNLTPESFRALAKKGWIEAPAPLMRRYGAAAPASDDPTRGLLAAFRNNCLSCHNPSARAVGRNTAFVLAPGRPYTAQELRALLHRRSTVMGRLGHPVVVPGAPQRSELVLRLQGASGRRRMPPAEGGLPDRDRRLIALASSWVAGVAQGR